jgi:hypothetical protein
MRPLPWVMAGVVLALLGALVWRPRVPVAQVATDPAARAALRWAE